MRNKRTHQIQIAFVNFDDREVLDAFDFQHCRGTHPMQRMLINILCKCVQYTFGLLQKWFVLLILIFANTLVTCIHGALMQHTVGMITWKTFSQVTRMMILRYYLLSIQAVLSPWACCQLMGLPIQFINAIQFKHCTTQLKCTVSINNYALTALVLNLC